MTTLTVEAAQLSTALSRVGKIVATGAKLPVLQHVLLDVSADTLAVSATDMEQWARIKIPARSTKPGQFTLPGRDAAEFVKRLPEGAELTIERAPEKATLSTGRIRVRLDTLDGDMFPAAMALGDHATTFILSPQTWLRMAGRVAHAICANNIHTYLCGIHVHAPDGELRMVATDARRMAIASTAAPLGLESFPGAIVPTKAVNSMQVLLAGVEDLASFGVTENLIHVETTGMAYTARLLDGAVHKYEHLVPPIGHPFRLPVKTLLGALGRAQLFAEKDSRAGSVIVLDITADHIDITAGMPSAPVYEERIEHATGGVQPMRIALSSPQLRDVIEQMDGEEFELDIKDSDIRSVIRATSPGDQSALYLLTPLRIAEQMPVAA